MKRLVIAVAIVCWAVPAWAQFGRFQKGLDQAKKLQGLKVTEQEEQEIGADVSQRLRLRYGVVQDPAVTRYVTLVGTVIAQASSRPDLPWRFIVLDTDAVNAFAAPGGYIHITRGALGLMDNEAELAGVLGHEIGHVTEKHTIKAIQKSNAVKLADQETLSGNKALLKQAADKTYDSIIENAFDRDDEMDADKVGVAAANKVGYAPIGLADFLERLAERNKGATTKHGLFASHPGHRGAHHAHQEGDRRRPPGVDRAGGRALQEVHLLRGHAAGRHRHGHGGRGGARRGAGRRTSPPGGAKKKGFGLPA